MAGLKRDPKAQEHLEVIRVWIERCLESEKLTKWEGDFVESIKDQFEDYGSLSPRQEEILERIYAERT